MDASSGTAASRSHQQNTVATSYRAAPGPLEAALETFAARAQQAAEGLFRTDPSVWSADADVRRSIGQRLGWLRAASEMASAVERVRAFAENVRREFSHVVLLGMGGSSLAPEVMRAVLGSSADRPAFHMLDSTDPAAVRSATTPPARTLYILASKSGTTIEPNALAAHFRAALQGAGVARWTDHFVAITDEGTALAQRARTEGFRETFINPSDIGGRYSALSLFGLVPAALMGHDIAALLRRGEAMLDAARSLPAARNPAVALGLLMGAGARHGRDKLTLLLPADLEPFGLWVEQLVAESTGKHGVGVVPIAGEDPSAASPYGADRVFVYNRLRSAQGDRLPAGASADGLRSANHPVAEIDWDGTLALGAEFMRWEIATAVAGALLEINPFDEPNVQQAKDATRSLLDVHGHTGTLPMSTPAQTVNQIALAVSPAARKQLGDRPPSDLLSVVTPGDYVALLAYLPAEPGVDVALRTLRRSVGQRTHAATMFGYGPRYLHSTGQLHKGGPNTGVFILMTATPAHDLAVPDQPFTFGTLELAQALGDFSSLGATGRRAIHVHLPRPDAGLIGQVTGWLCS